MANPYGGYPGQQQAYGAPGAPGYGQPGYGAPPGGFPPQHPPGGYGGPPQGGYGPPPGMDPAVYQWFVAIDVDKSGHLNAHELQQALTNSNWSHFNAETCRLMVSMFDKNQSGKIDIHEFSALWNYINQWKSVFDRYDRDRSGYVEHSELHLALSEMGYRLTPDFINLMMRRFDTENLHRLKFDNFIQACVMLKTLTDGFRQRDQSMQGVITINYEDFMSMVLLHMPLSG